MLGLIGMGLIFLGMVIISCFGVIGCVFIVIGVLLFCKSISDRDKAKRESQMRNAFATKDSQKKYEQPENTAPKAVDEKPEYKPQSNEPPVAESEYRMRQTKPHMIFEARKKELYGELACLLIQIQKNGRNAYKEPAFVSDSEQSVDKAPEVKKELIDEELIALINSGENMFSVMDKIMEAKGCSITEADNFYRKHKNGTP